MDFASISFASTDWFFVPSTDYPGEIGTARWRTREEGSLRTRMVEYSAGFVADHWCTQGHVFLCLEGEMVVELEDGRAVTLRPGMSCQLPDGQGSHRTRSINGARFFAVDEAPRG